MIPRGKTPIFNAGRESYKRYFKRKEETAPEVSIVFNPFMPPLTPLELTGKTMDRLLVSMNCMKSRSQPGGFFTFTIVDKPGEIKTFNVLSWKRKLTSLRELFRPATLVQLWIDGLHVMTGYVVQANRQVSDRVPLLTVEVSELGNLYAESIISKQLTVWGLDTTILGDLLNQIKLALGGVSGLPLPEAVTALCKAFWASTLLYARGVPKPYYRFSDGIPAAARMFALPPPLGAVSSASLLETLLVDTAMYEVHGGSSFWEYLKYMVPDPFCEMFTESGGRTICTGRLTFGDTDTPGGVLSDLPGVKEVAVPGASINISPLLPGLSHVVLRTAPYDNPLLGWTAFKQTFPIGLGVPDLLIAGDFVIIDDRDVLMSGKSLGYSMLKQYNIFDVGITAGGGNDGAIRGRPSVASGPIYPFGYGGVKTFPLRCLDVTVDAANTSQLGYAAQKSSRSANLRQKLILSDQLNVWFRNNHRMLEGTITAARFLPHARPGMLLLYLKPPDGTTAECPDDLGTYYIDNVSHDFQAGQAPTTALSVIRGTPTPSTMPELARMITEWEVHPITPEFWDYPRT